MKAHEEHRAHSPKQVKVGVISISSSRYRKMLQSSDYIDESGDKAVEMLKTAGHKVVTKQLVDDDIEVIRSTLLKMIYQEGVDSVIMTGGTGLSKRDVTIEAVKPFLDKELEGFGEILRIVSYQKIGTSAYLSRAIAGAIDGRVVYCLPGSPDALGSGLELILPELPHAVYIAKS